MIKTNNHKLLICILLILSLCFTFSACGEKDSSTDNNSSISDENISTEDSTNSPSETTQDQIDEIQNEIEQQLDYQTYENTFVRGVKNAVPNGYQDITIGEAFDYFFTSPKWTSFEGVKENETKAYDIVEFTGNCLFEDVEVEALIQFTYSSDYESFNATYFSLNDVPMTFGDLYELLEKVYSDYTEVKNMQGQKATPSN